MNCPKYDFHIHTKYVGCANATMAIPAIIKECQRLGVVSLGITDHLDSPDQLQKHIPIINDIKKLNTTIPVYLGAELDFTRSDQDFAFNQEIKEKYQFQFAIGGVHSIELPQYSLKKMIDIHHGYHLKVCQDPLVQVLVHPYWFGPATFSRNNWPWFNSMKPVPVSYTRELAQVSKETGTAIEINGHANLKNPSFSEDYVKEYHDYLAILADEGGVLSLGSDAHDVTWLEHVQASWQAAEKMNLSPDRIWHPQGRPFIGG